jgi:hypothetical protein
MTEIGRDYSRDRIPPPVADSSRINLSKIPCIENTGRTEVSILLDLTCID